MIGGLSAGGNDTVQSATGLYAVARHRIKSLKTQLGAVLVQRREPTTTQRERQHESPTDRKRRFDANQTHH